MRKSMFGVVAAVCSSLVACGSKGSGDGGDGGESDTGAETGVPASCEDYASDADIGPGVTITVKHEGTTPVYFVPVGCGGAFPIQIKPEGGESFGFRPSECLPVYCEQFLDSEDCSLACNDCEPPPGGRIDPAAARDDAWSGVMHTPMMMVAECAPGDMCQTQCLRQNQAPAGKYELELTVYGTCSGTCDCEGDPIDGVCQIWQYGNELSDPMTFAASIDYPTETAVELVIGP